MYICTLMPSSQRRGGSVSSGVRYRGVGNRYLNLFIIPVVQIEGTTDIDAFRAELTENMDLLMECGYTKPVSRADLGDKPDIIQSVTLHKVVLVSLAELSQFRKGLATLGVATALKDYPHLLQSFFSLRNNDQLTSGMFIQVYDTRLCWKWLLFRAC